MNIKDEFTSLIQEMDKGSKMDKLLILSKILELLLELGNEGVIIPENVLEKLTNDQQRSVLMLSVTGFAMILEGK